MVMNPRFYHIAFTLFLSFFFLHLSVTLRTPCGCFVLPCMLFPPFFLLLLHLLMTLHILYERFMFACKYTFFFFHLFLHLSFYHKGLSSVRNAEVQKYERQRSVAECCESEHLKENKEQKAMEQVDRSFLSDQLEGHSCIYRGQDDRLDRSISNCLIIESVF